VLLLLLFKLKVEETLPSVEEALILVERLQVQGEILADILSMFLLRLWEGEERV
jgi:hypothetical protein